MTRKTAQVSERVCYTLKTPTPTGGTAGVDLPQPTYARGSAMTILDGSTRPRASARFFSVSLLCRAVRGVA